MTRKSKPSFARMPWYPRDFASSTPGWPTPAWAFYRKLLDIQWDLGGSTHDARLPEDSEELRAVAGASPEEWKIAWRYLASKFPKVEGGGRRNARLEDHRADAIREFQGRRKGAETTNRKLGRGNGAAANQATAGEANDE